MATVTTTVEPVQSIRRTLNATQQSGLDADVAKINSQYDKIASEAYAAQLANSKKLENQAGAAGTAGSGYTETSKIALQNNYLNNLLENEQARAEAIQDADKYYQELAKEEEATAYEREMQERSMALQENEFAYQKEQDALDRETAAEQTAYDREQDAKAWEYQYNQLNFDQSMSEREMALQEAEFAYEQYLNNLSLSSSGSGSGSSVNAVGEPTGNDVSAYEAYYGNDENVQSALTLAQKFVANTAGGRNDATALQAQFDSIVKMVEKNYGTAAAEAYRQYVVSNMGWGSSDNGDTVNAQTVASLYTTFINNNGNKTGTAFTSAYNSTYNAIRSTYGEATAEAFASAVNSAATEAAYTYDDAALVIRGADSQATAAEKLAEVLDSDVLTSAEKSALMDDYEKYWGESSANSSTAKVQAAMDKLENREPFKSYLENGEWTTDAAKQQAIRTINSAYPALASQLLAAYGLKASSGTNTANQKTGMNTEAE